MPYIYSIETKVYEDGILPQQGGMKRYELEYIPVSQEVAEVHDDGCYKLISNAGQEMTSWMNFFMTYREADTTRIGTGKPLKDAIGLELAGGDFVMVSDGKYTTLKIQEVVNFTPKKIRVRSVNGFGMGNPKYPSDLVKIDKSLFF